MFSKIKLSGSSTQELLWNLLHPRSRPSGKNDKHTLSSKSASDDKADVTGSTEKSEPPAPVPVKNESPSLYALVVGINEYKSDDVMNLSGAVPDANAFQEFLEKTLSVPGNQIRNLRNEQATRAAIIQAFRDLISDPNIKPGDAVVIFYAGHGGETNAPMGWDAGGDKVQMLIPHDFRSQIDGRDVHGIPDRSLGALLTALANAKGDNITVVFDCCHSGSGTRTSTADVTRMARVTHVPDNVPANLDQRIWQKAGSGERGTEIPAGFLYQGLRSHVLLAACSERETAKEENGRGMFTQALLNEITIAGADKLTYRDLFQRIPSLPEQNPQCEGFNVGRILFNAKASSPGRVFHTVRSEGDKFILSAGAAHGVTDGAEFAVYQDSVSPSIAPPLGNLVVLDANAFDSTMDVIDGTPRFSLTQPAFALQTKAGAEEDLRLHIVMDEKLLGVFEALAQEMQSTGSNRRRMLLVEKEQAELDIELENDEVVFNIMNKLVTQFGLHRMPYRVSPNLDDVFPVIRAMAHFQWHLRRTNRRQLLQNKVRIEVRELEQLEDEFDDDFDPVIKPTGGNLNSEGVVEVVGGDKMYGFKIINDTGLALYPALFYFDNSDLSITSYYQPSIRGKAKVDAPLGPKGSLTIGYGSGGSSAFSFILPVGQKVDVGFLKLFLSTEHVDHSNIPQYSPFNKGERDGGKLQPKILSTWDTILVTVVIR